MPPTRQPPVKAEDGHQVLDLDRYVPYFLVAVTNAITRGAGREYLAREGIGIMDWRVMTTLAISPGCAAHDITTLVHLDKGAVSRSLTALEGRGLATSTSQTTDPRRKSWRLTRAGWDLHDQILPVALQREQRLLSGVTPDELEVLLTVMRKLRGNLDNLEEEW